MTKALKILTPLLILNVFYIQGQSFPLFSQYLLNEFTVNPSMAGIDGMTSVNVSGRQQWAFSPKNEFPTTPQTFSASISTRIIKSPGSTHRSKGYKKLGRTPSGRVAVGAAIFSDYNGPISKSGMQGVYTYHISLLNSQLSFGLAGLLYQLKIDGDQLDFDPNNKGLVVDSRILNIIDKPQYICDAAAGATFSTSKYHIGLSCFQLFEAGLKLSDSYGLNLTQTRYYYLTAAYKYQQGYKYEIEPSLVVRTDESLNVVADISGRLVYQKLYWGGIGFRTTGDFILLAGLKMGKYYLGYSLDYGFNKITQTSYGSHEILLAAKFGDSTRRYRWWERY